MYAYCRPSPKIDDLEEASHAFCSLKWNHVQSELQDTHPYTKNSQLAHRCIEALYIVTLLEHAFGIDGQERNITLTLDVSMHILTCRLFINLSIAM